MMKAEMVEMKAEMAVRLDNSISFLNSYIVGCRLKAYSLFK